MGNNFDFLSNIQLDVILSMIRVVIRKCQFVAIHFFCGIFRLFSPKFEDDLLWDKLFSFVILLEFLEFSKELL